MRMHWTKPENVLPCELTNTNLIVDVHSLKRSIAAFLVSFRSKKGAKSLFLLAMETLLFTRHKLFMDTHKNDTQSFNFIWASAVRLERVSLSFFLN